MIETPADYRSFVFCTANKTPVNSLRSGIRSFVFYNYLYQNNTTK